MHYASIFRVLGVLLMLFSLTMLTPTLFSFLYQEGTAVVFFEAFATTFACGGIVWIAGHRLKNITQGKFTKHSSNQVPPRFVDDDLGIRDGFLITAMFWFVLGLFGCLPFLLVDSYDISLTDAIFESISGLTTTGATVLVGLDSLPRSILFYRQQLQWLGGIGIIVIAVAILPMLGIGGMQLYRAETPGPVKDSKLTPRITGTAKALFQLYLMLTLACTVCYWLAGMDYFDAISHGFSTISIGGFSTHDQSMGYFTNPAIMVIATFFMLIAGINFALHFHAWRSLLEWVRLPEPTLQKENQEGSVQRFSKIRVFFKRLKLYFHQCVESLRRVRPSVYLSDPELWFYLAILFVGCVITVLTLVSSAAMDWPQALLHGVFQVVSITTTTGFASTDFSAWPTFLPFMLFALAFAGGCAGSTGGGMKVVRVLLMVKQGLRELMQLTHPHAIIPVKLGNRSVPDRVMSAVWGFIAVYITTFIILTLVLLGLGSDFITAYSSTAASLNNLGPGLGAVSAHYGDLNSPSKWVLCFAMLLGRLEIFTLLVLFTPAFWRK